MSNATGLRLQGDTVVRFLELTDKDPWITDGSADTVEQIRGAGLVPKRALDVMECEVNRLLVFSSHAVVPPALHSTQEGECVSVQPSVYLSICSSVCPSIHPSVCLPLHQFVCPCGYSSVCLSVCSCSCRRLFNKAT